MYCSSRRYNPSRIACIRRSGAAGSKTASYAALVPTTAALITQKIAAATMKNMNTIALPMPHLLRLKFRTNIEQVVSRCQFPFSRIGSYAIVPIAENASDYFPPSSACNLVRRFAPPSTLRGEGTRFWDSAGSPFSSGEGAQRADEVPSRPAPSSPHECRPAPRRCS